MFIASLIKTRRYSVSSTFCQELRLFHNIGGRVGATNKLIGRTMIPFGPPNISVNEFHFGIFMFIRHLR